MMPPHISNTGLTSTNVRDHTHVTGRASVPHHLRVRTVEWPEREAFIAHLDRLKAQRGIRYDVALADQAEISHTSISNWRAGKQKPSLGNIIKLADALDVDRQDLAARAGVAEGLARASAPTQLPPELELLIDQYQTAAPNRRAELLSRVQFVTEWFDATTPRPGEGRTRRAS